MTKTDDQCVLLLADTWRRKPTHSIPPSSRCSCKRMGTSDWPLLRVTSIAQAGGAALCPTAVAMAADKLLSWMQGSKYTVHLYNKHLNHWFINLKKQRVILILWTFHGDNVVLWKDYMFFRGVFVHYKTSVQNSWKNMFVWFRFLTMELSHKVNINKDSSDYCLHAISPKTMHQRLVCVTK